MRNTKRALVLLMIIAVLASCGANVEDGKSDVTANNNLVTAPFLTDLAQAKVQAGESGKKILVDFWADW